MRTRREQMQAHRFVVRRIVAALLSGEPETRERPMRRLSVSMFVSVMVAVVGFAAFGVYGLVANPGRDLEPQTIVIERGTGSIYVFLDDRLHPVLNITSARLILGEPGEPRTVSPSSLVDIPRGPTLGIRDAPVALPEADDLLGLPWRVCSLPPSGAQTRPTTMVVVDRGLPGPRPLADPDSLYVTTGQSEFLLWNDLRLRVPDRSVAVALRLPTRPLPVGEPLVNTVGAGPDLAPPRVPGAGRDSGHTLGGAPAALGEVFVASDAHYLLTRDGLARIGEVTWTLLAADGADARPISASEAGGLLADPEVEPPGFPQRLPRPHPAATASPTICTAYLGGEATGPLGTRIEVFETVPDELAAARDAGQVTQTEQDPVTVADQVVIAGGRGCLAQAVPHAGTATEADTVYLVTDQGVKYPLGTGTVDARQALGYGEPTPVRVPAGLLAMIPTGPQLGQAAALTPQPVGTPPD